MAVKVAASNRPNDQKENKLSESNMFGNKFNMRASTEIKEKMQMKVIRVPIAPRKKMKKKFSINNSCFTFLAANIMIGGKMKLKKISGSTSISLSCV